MNTYPKRLLRMDAQDCFEFSQSLEGAGSLHNPFNALKNSSKGLNRGLYPRSRKMKRQTRDQGDSQPLDLSCSTTQGFRSVKKILFPNDNVGSVTIPSSVSTSVALNSSATSSRYHPQTYSPSKYTPSSTDIKPWRRTPEKRSREAADFLVDDESETPSKSQRTARSSKNKKMTTPQKNTLLNYFISTPPKNLENNFDSKLMIRDPQSDNSELPLSGSSTETKPLRTEKICADEIPLHLSPDGQTIKVSPTLSEEEIKIEQIVDIKKRNETMQCIDIADSDEERHLVEKVTKEFEDIYGLLGNQSWEWEDENEMQIDNRPSLFSLLPVEVIENILCHLPLHELCTNLTLVNKQWNSIISSEQFIPWKKKYYQLKYGVSSAQQSILILCDDNGMESNSNSLQGLLRFVVRFKPYKAATWEKMLNCLQWHSKYEWAKAVLLEHFPECCINQKASPWSTIACLCILSHSVKDISQIIKYLSHSLSGCLLIDVIDFLYCLATFFFHFVQIFKSNPGFHYRIYYALYLFENGGTVTASDISSFKNNSKGQQTIWRYGAEDSVVRLTHEQKRIVNHQLRANDTVKIVAFAGTGKTTTLVEFTKMWPSKKFLSVVYNKSVCEYAKKIFPSNVTCQTVHSLAFRTIGKWFRSKLKFQVKAIDYMQMLEGDNKMLRGWMVAKTIEKFVSSADDFITIAHVPDCKVQENGAQQVFTPEQKLRFCDDATRIWQRMIDFKDPDAKITHDVYLKIYQLEKFPIENYDCILLDEAQDYSAAMLSIFLSQKCPKIIVGDPHQQIYAFRGAINALDNLPATHTYYLTQSFRFGPEIAYAASCALEILKKEKRKTIVGGQQSGGISGKQKGQVAIIARTNFALFGEAVRICCIDNRPVRAAFLGGIRNYSLDQILDIYTLMQISQGEGTKETLKIKNKFINRFKSFQTLFEYAVKTEDVELQGKIKIVLTYATRLPEYIKKLREKCCYTVELAEIVFTTAHKSKGQEFDTVQLADDYLRESFHFNCPNLSYKSNDPTSDEANILYVAITRAKSRLILSPQVVNVFLVAGERFEYPVALKSFQDEEWFNTEKYSCISCRKNQTFPKDGNWLVMERKEIKLSNRQCVKGGLLCNICSHLHVFLLSDFIPSPTIGPPCAEFNNESLSPLLPPLEEKEAEEVRRKNEEHLRPNRNFHFDL